MPTPRSVSPMPAINCHAQAKISAHPNKKKICADGGSRHNFAICVSPQRLRNVLVVCIAATSFCGAPRRESPIFGCIQPLHGRSPAYIGRLGRCRAVAVDSMNALRQE